MKTKALSNNISKQINISESIIIRNGKKYEVELEVKEKEINIKPISRKRKNWDLVFKKMSERKDDKLLDKKVLTENTSWDKDEWKW